MWFHCLPIVALLLAPAWVLRATDADTTRRITARVDAFHADHHNDEPLPLRIVYFHPSDAPPQQDFEARLHRIMSDIQAFYSSEMERLGFADKPLPLELRDGALVIHRVQGTDPGNTYQNDTATSRRIVADARTQLKGRVDMDRDFVLLICGLCHRLANGSYFFNSPYFGMPGLSPRRGLCFAADCEMQDTLHYTEEEKRFVYREHLGKFDKSLGAFNRLYIGGIAHELGHGLGLPHTKEYPWQNSKLGTALMGSGNFTWRQELLQKKGSFLTISSGLRLLSHPLFTQSNRDRFVDVTSEATHLEFSEVSDARFVVKGRLAASPPAYAMLVDTDPEGRTDYNSNTWTGEVDDDGDFEVTIRHLQDGPNELRLTVLHMNGSTTRLARFPFQTTDGIPASLPELNHHWAFEQAERAYMDGRMDDVRDFAQAAERDGDSPVIARIRHLRELADGPPEPSPLSENQTTFANLSDVRWDEATVGWGQPARNQYHSSKQIRDGVCLMPGGRFHAKGLYAHAPARHVFSLGGEWETFTATVGLQEGVHPQGSAIFVVTGDGRELHRTEKLTETKTESIQIDITGIRTLTLTVESGKDNNANCWSVWGSPKIERKHAP